MTVLKKSLIWNWARSQCKKAKNNLDRDVKRNLSFKSKKVKMRNHYTLIKITKIKTKLVKTEKICRVYI